MLGSTRRLSALIATIALISLILAACGSAAGDTSGGTAVGSGATAAATSAPTATTSPASPTTAPTEPAATGGAGSGTSATATSAPTQGAPAAGQASPGGSTASPAAPTAATAAGGAASSTGAERYTIVPNSSKATYRVNETFVGRGFAIAVGSTGAFTGALYLDKSNPVASRIDAITVDISKLASDSSQRDNRIRQSWLESSKYPTATFVTRRLEGLPDTPYTEGQELAFKILGDLTVRDVTKEVTFDATGKIVGDTFTGTATTQFNMTDFGFDPPEIAGVLKAENGVILELAIEARRDQ